MPFLNHRFLIFKVLLFSGRFLILFQFINVLQKNVSFYEIVILIVLLVTPLLQIGT